MSRFYSKHQISKFDMKLNDDLINTQKFKKDLKTSLNDEYHRINVDSAKKKAVLQKMDYDGFHQMVLGADLKGIKKDEITNILAKKETVMNSSLTGKRLGEEIDVMTKNFIPTNKEKEIIKIFHLEENQMDLKKFMKLWKSSKDVEDKTKILKDNFENFERIINSDLIESDFFIDFLNSAYNSINIQLDDIYLNSIIMLLENKQFPTLKKFISKKIKANYALLYENYRDEKIEFILAKLNK